jgi:hypothetical protein
MFGAGLNIKISLKTGRNKQAMRKKTWGLRSAVALISGLFVSTSTMTFASCQDVRGVTPDPSRLSDYSGFYIGGD